ncbi:hypothetical protein OG394_31690 [Kribbella sp. NBC_01245]|uniref:hypothetical protein n=1 Tax=Kribbella sp. NBC_01245 TaxID=2903578 RepID=UPI002E2A976B|nr:hypothetical protein [Kribbella sp. NBC_01245]
MSEVNGLLRAARERTRSPSAPGESMSRAELADAVCEWLWQTTQTQYELDGHYIAKLERGAVRWPGAPYRAGLRHVLKVASDNELGFIPPGAAPPIEPDLTSCSTIGLEDDLVDAGDESVSLLTLAEESNLGELTVEQMHADLHRVAQTYLRVPTKPLFLRTRGIRDRAFKLLSGRQQPAQTRDLYAAAGWSLTLLAWMSVDLGRPDIAESHTRTAWACAESADHDDLRAWVRAAQHTAAFWQDDFGKAAVFAADGLRFARGSSKTFLAAAHAVDLARAGQFGPARQALELAKSAEFEAGTNELGGPLLCSPERAEAIWSDAHLWLGEAAVTAEHADRSVRLFEAAAHAQRNYGSERMVRLQQVKARLELGELDGAVEALDAVLPTAPEFRVRPLIQRISEVAAQTRTPRYLGEAKARAMHETIREFVRRPATTRPTR